MKKTKENNGTIRKAKINGKFIIVCSVILTSETLYNIINNKISLTLNIY